MPVRKRLDDKNNRGGVIDSTLWVHCFGYAVLAVPIKIIKVKSRFTQNNELTNLIPPHRPTTEPAPFKSQPRNVHLWLIRQPIQQKLFIDIGATPTGSRRLVFYLRDKQPLLRQILCSYGRQTRITPRQPSPMTEFVHSCYAVLLKLHICYPKVRAE